MPKINKHLFNQVLVNQYGAIKPPWISKEVYYKLPFNFCDRWCEKCNLRKICRVYIQESQRRDNFIKAGINLQSMEATFTILHETFGDLRTKLEKEMKRLGITQKNVQECGEEEHLKEDLVQSDYLYKISLSITKKLNLLYQDLEYCMVDLPDDIEKIKSKLENLVYFMNFFAPKIYRAILSDIEKDEDDTVYDDKTSAFLANIAIKKIVLALQFLSNFKKFPSKIKIRMKKLIVICEDLFDLVEKRFAG